MSRHPSRHSSGHSSRHPSRSAAVPGALLLAGLAVLAGLASGCADPSRDPRAQAPGGSSASDSGMRNCPLPDEPQPAAPSPCISQDPAQKYAENHAYRREQEITDEERAGARGKTEALAAALRKLAGKPAGETEVRAAAAAALGLTPDQVEYRAGNPGSSGKTVGNLLVGGGGGRVCVNGGIDTDGRATAEVVGRTMDGTCLPGLGGH